MSNQQKAIELSKYVLDMHGKIAFMLITASTASIAYILAQVKGETWSSLLYFPIYSLILLATSFMFGYSHLSNKANAANANSMILQMAHDLTMLKEMSQYADIIDKIGPKATRASRLQYITFIFGAITYAIYVFISIYIKN